MVRRSLAAGRRTTRTVPGWAIDVLAVARTIGSRSRLAVAGESRSSAWTEHASEQVTDVLAPRRRRLASDSRDAPASVAFGATVSFGATIGRAEGTVVWTGAGWAGRGAGGGTGIDEDEGGEDVEDDPPEPGRLTVSQSGSMKSSVSALTLSVSPPHVTSSANASRLTIRSFPIPPTSQSAPPPP